MEIKKYQDLSPQKVLAIQDILAESHILKFMNVEVELLAPGFARIRIPFRRELIQGFGTVQGGIIAFAGDTAAGIAFLTLLEPGEAVVTIELKINFLRPVRKSDIICESRIVHKGNLISLGEFDVKTPEGILVGKGSATLTSREVEGECEDA